MGWRRDSVVEARQYHKRISFLQLWVQPKFPVSQWPKRTRASSLYLGGAPGRGPGPGHTATDWQGRRAPSDARPCVLRVERTRRTHCGASDSEDPRRSSRGRASESRSIAGPITDSILGRELPVSDLVRSAAWLWAEVTTSEAACIRSWTPWLPLTGIECNKREHDSDIGDSESDQPEGSVIQVLWDNNLPVDWESQLDVTWLVTSHWQYNLGDLLTMTWIGAPAAAAVYCFLEQAWAFVALVELWKLKLNKKKPVLNVCSIWNWAIKDVYNFREMACKRLDGFLLRNSSQRSACWQQKFI